MPKVSRGELEWWFCRAWPKLSLVEMKGFEPSTPASRTHEPLPESFRSIFSTQLVRQAATEFSKNSFEVHLKLIGFNIYPFVD